MFIVIHNIIFKHICTAVTGIILNISRYVDRFAQTNFNKINLFPNEPLLVNGTQYFFLKKVLILMNLIPQLLKKYNGVKYEV